LCFLRLKKVGRKLRAPKASLLPNSAALVLIAPALGSFLLGHESSRAHAITPVYDLLLTSARIVDGSSQAVLANGQMNEARRRVALRGPGYGLTSKEISLRLDPVTALER